jgi:hypothetical protein
MAERDPEFDPTEVDVLPPDGETTEPPSLGETLELELDKATAKDDELPDAKPGRDAQGRFLAKEEQSKAPEPDAAARERTQTDANGRAQQQPAPNWDNAPASWEPKMREAYAAIPQEARAYIHERELQLQQGFQSIAQRAQIAQAVLNEFVPYAQQLQAEGATPIAAIRSLLRTAHDLRTGGPEYRKLLMHSLAQQYGVDLSQPINADLARAEAQNANLLSERTYGTAAAQSQALAQTQNDFAAFANDPQNEFFPQVRGIMASLIENGTARDLQEAYNYAVGMHPQIREVLIGRAVEQNGQQQRQANAANVSVKGAPSGGKVRPSARNESLRDAIARNFEELS